MKPILVDKFEFRDFQYEHRDYGNEQHRYSKTPIGKHCTQNSTKAEFELRKQEYSEQLELNNLF